MPHDLRHTTASLAVSAGANVKALQRLLGHQSAAVTLDVYRSLFDSDLDAVAERLDQAAEDQLRTVPANVVPIERRRSFQRGGMPDSRPEVTRLKSPLLCQLS